MPAFLGRATKTELARAPIRVDNDSANGPTAPPPPATAAVAPAARPAAAAPFQRDVRRPSQSPLQAEETVMDLERRLGLRGPES